MRSASLLNFLARRFAVDMIVFRDPRAAAPRPHLPPGLVRRLHVVELPPHARHTLARKSPRPRAANATKSRSSSTSGVRPIGSKPRP